MSDVLQERVIYGRVMYSIRRMRKSKKDAVYRLEYKGMLYLYCSVLQYL